MNITKLYKAGFRPAEEEGNGVTTVAIACNKIAEALAYAEQYRQSEELGEILFIQLNDDVIVPSSVITINGLKG